MTMPHRLIRLLGYLAVAVALAAGLAAETQAPAPTPAQAQPKPQQPTFRVATNFVEVDAYPTSDGRPVLDLTAGDFEVLEDGKPQTIETFEHVVARAAGPQETRVEPTNAEAANQAAADPANRVFVVFLDTYHVEGAAAVQIRRPLENLLNRVIGQDDLVGVMVPQMAASDLTFTRRMASIDAILAKGWDWGRRDQMTLRDPQEQAYEICYPSEMGVASQDTLAGKMIERRREKLTLDALRDLVLHLEGLREGRKAVLTVTDGWRLFREDRTMLSDESFQSPGIFVGPGGKIATGTDPRMSAGAGRAACDRDRVALAMLDDDQAFRDLLNVANRANVSFYPIDPRGLPVFDTPIGPGTPPGVVDDIAQLRGRIDSLQTMALNTDGIAVVNSNDVERGMKRIVEDLTSYYLLGYYSTNSKPDGRYRRITVRVKRAGVDVRARRGYQAPSEADIAARNAAMAAAGSPPTAADLAAESVNAALGALSLVRSDVPVRFLTGYAWRTAPDQGASQPSGGPGAMIWVTGELDTSRTVDDRWRDGGEATITVTTAERRAVGSATAPLTRAVRSFRVLIPEDMPLDPGVYELRVSPRSSTGSPAPTEAFRVTIPPRPAGQGAMALGQPVIFRRGPFTGTTFQPAADLRFRRQEWIRVEVSKVGTSDEVAGRILDRAGNPLNIPVRVSERTEGSAVWIQGEVALAPLAVGDYRVEISARGASTTERVLAAFRIVP
jgi:VWFA-related protein